MLELNSSKISVLHKMAFQNSNSIAWITDLRGRRVKRFLQRPGCLLNEGWKCEPTDQKDTFAYRLGERSGDHQTLLLDNAESRLTLTSVHVNFRGAERKSVRHVIRYCLKSEQVMENTSRFQG